MASSVTDFHSKLDKVLKDVVGPLTSTSRPELLQRFGPLSDAFGPHRKLSSKLYEFSLSTLSFGYAVVPSLSFTPSHFRLETNPVEAARLQLTVAFALNALVFMHLKTKGENTTESGVKDEINR